MITLTALLLGTALCTPQSPAAADVGPQVDPTAPAAIDLVVPDAPAPTRPPDASLRDPFHAQPVAADVTPRPSSLLDPFHARPTVARPASTPATLRSPFESRPTRVAVEDPAPIPPADLRDPFA